MDMKSIFNFQKEVEELHNVKKSKELEIVSLKGDNLQLQNINTSKSSEIQNLKGDINRHYEVNTRMSIDKRDKEGLLSALNAENNSLMNEISIVQNDIQQLQAKKAELEDYLKSINIERSQLIAQNSQFSNQKAQLQNDLNNRISRIKYLEIQKEDAQKILSQLNQDLNELQRILEQTKAEAYNYNRLFLDEQQTGKQLISRLQLLESQIQQKIAQINDFQQQNEILRNQNAELMDLNSQLSYDLETLKKHIEVMTERNSLYLDELDMYEEQDEQLRQILLRKTRVVTTKITSDERMRKTLMLIQNS